MSKRSQVELILNGLQLVDPRLHTALRLMLEDIDKVYEASFPTVVPEAPPASTLPAPAAADSLTITLRSDFVHFEFTSSDSTVRAYELRKGTDWATASFVVRTPSHTVDILPIPSGIHTYLLKTLNADLGYSDAAISQSVNVAGVGSVTISPSVIDNNVLLKWSEPTSSFTIAYYNVYKNTVLVGKVRGTFTTVFETVSGSFNYNVVGVDVAGNVGPDSIVTVTVDQPPDYVLRATFISTFTGTITNGVLLSSGRLLVCVDGTETFEDHFDDNFWTSPQDQITAGYPVYIEPGATTASYVETIDYGALFTNVIVNLDWNTNTILGAVSLVTKLEGSTDGTTWSAQTTGASAFYASLRYVRVTVEFTGALNALMEFFNFRILLDVKQVMDSGKVSAVSTDAGGTTVNFNVAFKDVISITATANSTVLVTVIIDFTDIPNPTTFKVLAFNSAGARVNAEVNWKARGIL